MTRAGPLANTFMFVSSAKTENDNLAESSDDWEDYVPAATAAEKRTAHSSTELSLFLI